MTLSERRLLDLLNEIIAHGVKVPQSRPALDDPALTLCLADLGRLVESLADAAELCRQHKLGTARLLGYRNAINEEISAVILPIMARIEGVEAARQKYGPFHLESDDERDAFRWTGLIGTVAGIRQHAESLLRAIEANAKPVRRKRTSRDVLTPPQAAEQLGVDSATVIGWIRSGELKASNVGKGSIRPRYKIKQSDLDEFLKSRQPEMRTKSKRRSRKPLAEDIEFFS